MPEHNDHEAHLAELLTEHGSFALQHFRTHPKSELPALFTIYAPRNTRIHYGAAFRNDADKDAFGTLMRAALIAHQAVVYVFMCESYQIRLKHDEEAPANLKGDPRSQECILAHASCRARNKMASWSIQRGEDGGVIDLVRDDPTEQPLSTTGRFVPSFPPLEFLCNIGSTTAMDVIDDLLKRCPFERLTQSGSRTATAEQKRGS